jgi:glycerophosphoryl diester phosphodiesterase
MPENTVPAFRRALELGVTTLELDVQSTRDRVLIVSHDQRPNPKLCRRDDGRPVTETAFKELTYDSLADFDCGSLPQSKFPHQERVAGARIPKLEEVLSLIREAAYPVQLSVEIKLQRPELALPVEELAELLVGLIRRYELEERTIVQSFEPSALMAVRRLAPGIRRALLVRRGNDYRRWIEDGTATILSPKHGNLRAKELQRLQASGVPVIPWTVNDPADIRRLIARGVDGVISDYPDRVLAILGEDDAQRD